MKKIILFLFSVVILHSGSKACNAFFSHTYACAGDTVFFNAFDQYAVYTWDFGDTASGVANVSHDTDTYHIYLNPGTYFVTLFVNIGAEWDYRTEIITIGTDCFNAAFSYQCGGDSILNFTNESTGDYTSSLWNFGDTTSGTNDTSTSANPAHTFSAPGNYQVSLITSDGINSDTVFQTVAIDTNCLYAQFYNMLGGNCVQDTTTIIPYFSGNITSYNWDFGDTASGIMNYSTDTIGIHQYSATGIYLVTLIISDGIQTDTFYDVQNIIDCNVWPGNANTDGEVNMEDLFAIGIYYNDSGTVRNNASNIWTGQPAADWNSSGFNSMYLQDLVDKKHADCNGDGVINSLDINVMAQNYGSIHPNYHHNDNIQMMPVTSADPVVQILTPTQYTGSANVSLPVDLSAIDSVRSAYGIALRIYYDATQIVPGSITVDYSNGWMGINGTDLTGLVKDFPAGGYVEFGIVRTDGNTKVGNGTIAMLNFTLNQQSGSFNFMIDPVVRLISNSFLSQEIFLPVSETNSMFNFTNVSVSEISENNIVVYPNPVHNILNIQTISNTNINSYTLTDLSGRIIKSEKLNSGLKKLSVDCSDIASGFYLIIVNTSSGRFNTRVEIR